MDEEAAEEKRTTTDVDDEGEDVGVETVASVVIIAAADVVVGTADIVDELAKALVVAEGSRRALGSAELMTISIEKFPR